jgi:hypothetical protein
MRERKRERTEAGFVGKIALVAGGSQGMGADAEYAVRHSSTQMQGKAKARKPASRRAP